MNDEMFTSDSPWVLIDTSYFKKCAANAVWRSIKEETGIEDSPNFDPMSLPKFASDLASFFDGNLFSLIGKYAPIFDRNKLVFCIDCPRPEIWRKSFFSGYKSARDKIVERFSYIGINAWLNEWMAQHKHVIKVRCAEADDVIAHLANKLAVQNAEEVIIVSADKDLLQLGHDHIKQIDVYGEEITIASKLEKDKVEFEPTVDNFLIYLILQGDTSDSIPSIKPGKCGPKKAAELIKNREAMKEFIMSDQAVAEAFRRNSRVISLKQNNIPEEINSLIVEATKEIGNV